LNLGSKNISRVRYHFFREADHSGILEELLKNSERNPAKSNAEIDYKPAHNL
jgi:hypothetical protein